LKITILHTNDFHGTLDHEKAEFLRDLRVRTAPALYFDSGDCVRSGNLAVPVRADPAWKLLSLAQCDAGTLGNRETHILESAFRAKVSGAKHPLLCANLRRKDGSRPLPGSLVLGIEGLCVGVLGVMVPMVTERMAARAASAYLWDKPIDTACAIAKELRHDCDLLVALTHIGLTADRELAEACPVVDLILGGHSHTKLESPERIGRTWICQGGSHGKYVGRYVWEIGRGLTDGELLPLP